MPLVNFQKNVASFPSIFARISKFEHFRTEYTRNKIFWGKISKNIFHTVHLGPRWVPKRFFKFLIF
jgi:hypothetical protein